MPSAGPRAEVAACLLDIRVGLGWTTRICRSTSWADR